MTPSEGMKKLQVTLKQLDPEFSPKHPPIDLADLRPSMSEDKQFGNVVSAIADAIELIHKKRERVGSLLGLFISPYQTGG